MIKTFLATIAMTLTTVSMASRIAIIDSGTDYKHTDLQKQAWTNRAEIPGNDRDEDRNGYQDDIYGWNFAENNNQVIDYSYIGTLNDDIKKFFDIQTKNFYGLASADEIKWVRAKVKDKAFIKRISIYGNFMHGTHVTGIAVKGNMDAEFISVKLIPTEVKLPGGKNKKSNAKKLYGISIKKIKKAYESSNKGLGMKLLKLALGVLAKQQMNQMVEIAAYIDGHKADIANGSFGTGYPQAKSIVTALIKTFVKVPKEAAIEEGTRFLLNSMISEGKRFVAAAPNTLFVFAAGNDGLNNDLYPTSPTNIQADNVISVAASLGRSGKANFSNYGAKMVDVAAPGVGIKSTAPGDKYMTISGTSQAAPYIANVAAKIKDANPGLAPKDIKKILMKTVDFKDFLKGKVKSNGLINKGRAVRAAELSMTMTVNEAISSSKIQIADIRTGKSLMTFNNSGVTIPVLPLPSSLILR